MLVAVGSGHGTMGTADGGAKVSRVAAAPGDTKALEQAPLGGALVHQRRQMETRLRLRRRLLRIDPDASLAGQEHQKQDHTGDARTDRVSSKPLQTKPAQSKRVLLPKKKTSPLGRRGAARRRAPDVDDEDEDDDNDENSEEGDADDDEEEDEDEGDDNDGDDETVTGAGKPSKSDKSELSANVKLLFSHRDPRNRPPTVWFDYPSHINVTRELPVSATNRLVSVSASDCELFFKTHWERNCVKNAFAVAGLRRTKKRWSGWHVAWAKHMSREKFRLLKPHQAFSHFPDPWVIGRKDRLMKTLSTYKRRFGNSYAFFPEGFTLPDHIDAFKRATEGSPTSLWILKPPAAACGRGIRVVPAKDVDAFLTSRDNKEKKYVAQKYLANPLLVDGFKFDLRIYVLVTSVDPLRIYLFEEGLTRFCTTPYSLSNTKNRFAHLTNYSVNKKNKNFVENTDAESENLGNKWSMSALFQHLEATGVVEDVSLLRAQIKDVIRKTIIAAEAHLTPLMHQFVKGFRPQNIKCYELFGFDMMLDDICTPWLIEVNVSPSLMAASPLDKRVKGLLLSDIFHLVGVPVARDELPDGAIPEAFMTTNSNRPGSASSSTSTRAASVNKQLHELVHDASTPIFEKKHLELFTASDWTMLHEMEDEMERLGHFERIFPCESAQETAKYAPFFTCPRYSNGLCAKWIETKRRTRDKAIGKPSTKASGTVNGRQTRRSNSLGGLAANGTVARGTTRAPTKIGSR